MELEKIININPDETVLFLGGRIIYQELYSEKYCEYLNKKIKSLNPDKIICCNHNYYKLYFEKNILDKNLLIDYIWIWIDYLYNKTFKYQTKNGSINYYTSDHSKYINDVKLKKKW